MIRTYHSCSIGSASGALCLIVAVSLGCDQKGDSQTDELYVQRLDAVCAKAIECCDSTTLTILGYANQAACVDHGRRTSDLLRQELGAALNDGSLAIDLAQAKRCFDAIRLLSCDDWALALTGNLPADCHGFTNGNLALGETCRVDYSCKSRSCWYDNATSEKETGHCRKTVQTGESCSTDAAASCYPPLSCEMVSNTELAGFACVGAKSEGESCAVSSDCASDRCTQANTCTKACAMRPGDARLLGE